MIGLNDPIHTFKLCSARRTRPVADWSLWRRLSPLSVLHTVNWQIAKTLHCQGRTEFHSSETTFNRQNWKVGISLSSHFGWRQWMSMTDTDRSQSNAHLTRDQSQWHVDRYAKSGFQCLEFHAESHDATSSTTTTTTAPSTLSTLLCPLLKAPSESTFSMRLGLRVVKTRTPNSSDMRSLHVQCAASSGADRPADDDVMTEVAWRWSILELDKNVFGNLRGRIPVCGECVNRKAESVEISVLDLDRSFGTFS